ncbi:MAG: hypothetical protein L0Z62_19435 [Gemmataceae bacterium]|nr:hypothetical protein [Gemmataceae bacterium]
MPQACNPIALTFERLRAALPECLDTLHPDAHPETPLETLLPVAQRREAWRLLRQQGFPLPELQLPPEESRRNLLRVLRVAGSLALWLWWWPALLLALPLGVVVYRLSRPRAVVFPAYVKTVGELALYLTPYRDHREGGCRWTDEEVAAKVRMVVADWAGLPFEEVRPETKFADLMGC